MVIKCRPLTLTFSTAFLIMAIKLLYPFPGDSGEKSYFGAVASNICRSKLMANNAPKMLCRECTNVSFSSASFCGFGMSEKDTIRALALSHMEFVLEITYMRAQTLQQCLDLSN